VHFTGSDVRHQFAAAMGIAVVDRVHPPGNGRAGRQPGELLQFDAQRIFAVGIVG
jgi:hypothetical protein